MTVAGLRAEGGTGSSGGEVQQVLQGRKGSVLLFACVEEKQELLSQDWSLLSQTPLDEMSLSREPSLVFTTTSFQEELILFIL